MLIELETHGVKKKCLTAYLWKFVFLFFNKVQELGLEPAYRADSRTYKYIRKLMALPFLPEAEITPMFQRLRDRATTTALEALALYLEENWITSTMWDRSLVASSLVASLPGGEVTGNHLSYWRTKILLPPPPSPRWWIMTSPHLIIYSYKCFYSFILFIYLFFL